MVARWKRSDGDQVSFCRSSHLSVVSADTLQISAIDAGIKMRPTNEELLSMSPEFNYSRWSSYFANAPDKPVILAVPFAGCVHLIPINHILN